MEKKKFVRIPVNDKKLFIVPDKVIAISEKPREKHLCGKIWKARTSFSFSWSMMQCH